MSQQSKQAEERIALDRFREKSGLLKGEVARGADPPDFLITDGAHLVAVEMTRYHQQSGRKGSPGAKREALESRIVQRAQVIFEAANPDVHVMVSPYFVHDDLNRHDLEKHATWLADAVKALTPPMPSMDEPWTNREADWNDPELAGPEAIVTHLHVSRSRVVHRSLWDIGGAGRLSTDASEVETVIRDKESDLARYEKAAGECWLIIYALPQASAFFDFEVLTPHMWKSRFDGVVFIDVFSAHFVLVA